jgi:copper chaperone CopZ
MKKKFKCEVDCANCAQKLEDAIKKIEGVTDAKVNFMMQKLTLEAPEDRFEEIFAEVVRTAKIIEPDTVISEK